MEKAILLINPNAGQGKLKGLATELVARLTAAFKEVKQINLADPQVDRTQIAELAQEFDLVIAAGGDGTVHSVVNAIAPLEERPALAIIPGGTANDFARQLNIAQDPLDAVEQIFARKTEWIDIGQANTSYFLNFWGIGLITETSQSVDTTNKQTVGKLAYYLGAVQSIGKFTPFKVSIKSEQSHIEDEVVMVIIGNGSYTGGIRAFFPENKINDGLFEVVLIKEASIQTAWSILQAKLTKTTENSKGIITFRTNTLTINTEPNQQIDCDGEAEGHTPALIKALPKHINVIVG
ncbi:lipid kinase, YegS/Rv2252/BmrU family [Amphibacillus marinus]|uniref:Lipid kinase, YegS/Rv2252/BmrU family n=1 Tax=Amphibacillus marinus TaxID=872970 RepID=A0A1H8RXN7_9BACI|nr:diacylglycerol kinase family protein [Amphibacillus marinus]SEO71419.1 lipid kinase, YegS/Rv2252/BmrU family [Amphibacillus marinus]